MSTGGMYSTGVPGGSFLDADRILSKVGEVSRERIWVDDPFRVRTRPEDDRGGGSGGRRGIVQSAMFLPEALGHGHAVLFCLSGTSTRQVPCVFFF